MAIFVLLLVFTLIWELAVISAAFSRSVVGLRKG